VNSLTLENSSSGLMHYFAVKVFYEGFGRRLFHKFPLRCPYALIVMQPYLNNSPFVFLAPFLVWLQAFFQASA